MTRATWYSFSNSYIKGSINEQLGSIEVCMHGGQPHEEVVNAGSELGGIQGLAQLLTSCWALTSCVALNNL